MADPKYVIDIENKQVKTESGEIVGYVTSWNSERSIERMQNIGGQTFEYFSQPERVTVTIQLTRNIFMEQSEKKIDEPIVEQIERKDIRKSLMEKI